MDPQAEKETRDRAAEHLGREWGSKLDPFCIGLFVEAFSPVASNNIGANQAHLFM